MRIATWNVNSIRTRIERVTAFLQRHEVDVLAMQEIKCRPDQFPVKAFEDLGYQVVVNGLNQWNGVAIASRLEIHPVADRFAAQPLFGDPPVLEPRAVAARCGGVEVWSLYIPNGRELDHPHYAYKLAWLEALKNAAQDSLNTNPGQLTIMTGDFNVAPLDEDVWDMAAFEGATHVSAAERDALNALQYAGFEEVSRAVAPGWTYWDYQRLRFPKNQGMKIDFMWASPALAAKVSGGFIDREERKGKGASDHAPVVIDF